LAAAPSQSPQPAAQAVIWQLPLAQDSVAFARLHPTPQPPQFASVVSGCSQPSEVIELQLPNPGEHMPNVQTPVEQVSVAPGKSQSSPHAPQFASVLSGVSQPSAADPLQLPNPGSHIAIAQPPATHMPDAFAGSQNTPHPPQFASDVRVSISQPLEATPSQSAKPVEQAVIWQLPLAQLSVAFARLQVVPHEPQFAAVVSGASQPFESTPSQSSKPASHVPIAQLPVEQVSEA
jgi:hypothetical protein